MSGPKAIARCWPAAAVGQFQWRRLPLLCRCVKRKLHSNGAPVAPVTLVAAVVVPRAMQAALSVFIDQRDKGCLRRPSALLGVPANRRCRHAWGL